MGPDLFAPVFEKSFEKFQSAGPVWDPTRDYSIRRFELCHFNPRVPCGTRRLPSDRRLLYYIISIRGSRVGPDSDRVERSRHRDNFNPRVPCGTRQVNGQNFSGNDYFNPRVPCGTRLGTVVEDPDEKVFQSAGPVWDPTRPYAGNIGNWKFQSAGPVWDPTYLKSQTFSLKKYFNPRVPCGTRPNNFCSDVRA